MSQELHLHAERAIRKIKEIVGHAPVCLFQTALGQRPIPTRPMHTAEVDDHGHLWFLAPGMGECAEQLRTDPGIQLLFAHADEAEYMSIHGRATVSQDRVRIQELRERIPPGALGLAAAQESEAELCAIKVVPQDSYYWDAAENRGRSMVRMMVAGVFGQQGNEAVEGRLEAPSAPRNTTD